MKYQNKGFSIMFAIIIIVLVSFTSLYLLGFIIPYGKNVKGLENSAKAYYLGNSGVEQSLWSIKQNALGHQDTDTFSGPSDYSFEIIANGTEIPGAGLGNSNFDADWNKIGFNEPIQLFVGNNLITDWSQVQFYFRVPDFDKNGDNSSQSMAGDNSTIVLNWQLASSSGSLLPRDPEDFITAADINSSPPFLLSAKNGVDLNNNGDFFASFYSNNCGSGQDCALKISAISGLEMSGSRIPIPYLEYRIDTGPFSIPTRFTNINASGRSYGFRKDVNVKVPQLTTDQAFDFTVFQ